MFFLFAVFVLLAVVTGAWLYKVYKEQTSFAETRTMATIDCGKYYFSIDPRTVTYDNGNLYFEIENTVGSKINSIVVDSGAEKKEVNVSLSSGMIQPVSLSLSMDTWVLVYPKGCYGINYKNLTWEPFK